MKRLIPQSIAGRTMLVLLVGLTLSHIASTAIMSFEHDYSVTADDKLAAERIAVFSLLIDQAAPSEREELARSLSSPLLKVTLLSSEHSQNHGISSRLSDGSWVTFVIENPGSPTLWSTHSLLSTLVMIGAILVFGRWAASWASAPLSAFAKAADRLGRDVHASPMPEQGPLEVRKAAIAFNEMQTSIRRFVNDRTRLLAAISHDLRSPITRLRLRAEMLPASDSTERMLADLAEMEAMVNSTLEFARSETDHEKTQIVDLAATIETVCDNTTDMGLLADFAWPGRLVCACRPLAVKRALANLVENAARYGGRAMVFAHNVDKNIVITIEDNGPGIPEAEMEKVFSPFYRIEGSRNRKTGGIGLGLTVVRSIIRAHGGEIRLENRKEGGLRVTVSLPRGEEP